MSVLNLHDVMKRFCGDEKAKVMNALFSGSKRDHLSGMEKIIGMDFGDYFVNKCHEFVDRHRAEGYLITDERVEEILKIKKMELSGSILLEDFARRSFNHAGMAYVHFCDAVRSESGINPPEQYFIMQSGPKHE